MAERKQGFAPVFDENSKALILGSFPSVKSREVDFYYGHKQNRFWKMLCGYFGEEVPETVEGKKEFLYRRKIALWDVAQSCEIVNSDDATIKKPEIVDLKKVLDGAKIEKILLNGEKAYKLFLQRYKKIGIPYSKMQSTSPRNRRYTQEGWWQVLDEVFGIYRRT